MSGHIDAEQVNHSNLEHVDMLMGSVRSNPKAMPFEALLRNMMMPKSLRPEAEEGVRAKLEASMAPANAVAQAFRKNTRAQNFPKVSELAKSGALSKSILDVGTLTNMAAITGGQSLGYVSLDTQMARGTVRPTSFTLYQALTKSAAYQVVDYWPTVTSTGGAVPGAAFGSFGAVSSGVLATSAGKYQLSSIRLALALDGRAITTALAAQNSFVDIAAQENTNAALTILSSVNWAGYHGDPTIWVNQFQGLSKSITAANQYDSQAFYTAYAVSNGWSPSQCLYNMIYDVSAEITRYATFGHVTHAFMTPEVNASLQPLLTTILNNILTNDSAEQRRSPGLVVNGDLQGMKTRFGEIQFPIDLFISARDKPIQSIVFADGTNQATLVSPTPPASVTVANTAGTTQNGWTVVYAPAAGSSYVYAVASCDAFMNESQLTYSPVVTSTTMNGTNTVTITPPAANDAYAFRVFRSGQGYAKTTTANTAYSFRYIGVVLGNGANNVTFTDVNARIPGSETLFLLDLSEEDNALDYRYLLPLSRIELFAQNLYMPWAVATIGAIRNRIPQFHALIYNYVPLTPSFNPLSPNN